MQNMLASNLEKHLVRAQSLQEVIESKDAGRGFEQGYEQARGERAATQQRLRRGDGAQTPQFRGEEEHVTAGSATLDEEATPSR